MLSLSPQSLRIPLIALGVLLSAPSAGANDAPASAASCMACHGVDAPGADAVTPHIAGLRKNHLLAAMRDYRSGNRLHPQMQQAVLGLEDEALAVLAAWYAEQPWVAVSGAVDSELLRAGGKKALASCSSCHRRSGEGGIGAPRLAGQSVGYLIAASAAYRDGGRNSPAARGKGFVMGGLTDDEIRALSHYYASLR